ncbi:MAG: hemerythrin domain-containing protein [Proteobacteria bacterium]|nr:hemerythrin domain-containing protein [Pseudomonadota bacterium]
MLPIGPLMIEHRLIEKMILAIKQEAGRLETGGELNIDFLELIVDFIRTYADLCHHGKEEDILFKELQKKDLSDEQKRIMSELVEEHIIGRVTVKRLSEARNKYIEGKKEELSIIVKLMVFLADFYPKHIEKEDRHFFIPVMGYFTSEEKDALLEQGNEFDRDLIHHIYKEKYESALKLLSIGS